MADWIRRTMLAAAAALFAAAALPVSVAGAQSPLKVVATTGMIADAARQVGGDLVEVRALMGPGVDPHAYRQTRTDILALTRADLVLWHGLYLEAQMEDFMHSLEARRPVVAVAEELPRDVLLAHDDYENRYDPHVWMVPDLWSKVVVRVRDALIDARPEGEALFRANAESHLKDVAALSDYAKEVLATVPQESRVLVTAHDAFNYFGRAYDFEVLGIQGISTQSEAGLNRVAELVDTLVKRKIGAVFVESSVSDRNMRALIEGAAAKGQQVAVGGQLFSDAMGRDGSYEGTYIGMIDHNVTTITRALGGKAPERGMLGRLAVGS
ncbi:metal ABC transporter solute-binding protein, Zn/Mn family [Chelativorans salis]|uniref:Zinc ABC transporter substrate-binding protein n=1 Tax=Chelativorans salis TaxID=2978478 RepID=A0ABT2LUK8_9HYPH|nr:zinc ABC transporter substrate-binding protein [Chelativorans sp. EGI FJ00035]MCT7377774.1 zinc ABC transporter substrate-binding protein [Chelativorans sp. EGI FJ00035]